MHNATHVHEDSATQCRLCREKFGSWVDLTEHEHSEHGTTDAADYVNTMLAWATAKEQEGSGPFDRKPESVPRAP